MAENIQYPPLSIPGLIHLLRPFDSRKAVEFTHTEMLGYPVVAAKAKQFIDGQPQSVADRFYEISTQTTSETTGLFYGQLVGLLAIKDQGLVSSINAPGMIVNEVEPVKALWREMTQHGREFARFAGHVVDNHVLGNAMHKRNWRQGLLNGYRTANNQRRHDISRLN